MIKIRLPLPSRTQLEQDFGAHVQTLEHLAFELHKRIKHLLSDSGIQVSIKYRVKSFESYYKKILRRVSSPPSENDWFSITDLLGIRLVCPFIADIPVAEKILTSNFEVIEHVRKGAEFSFKEFGYESLHYLITLPQDISEGFLLPDGLVCEVQMRTILQDAWAEVEHELVYKSDYTPFDESLRRKLAALNANLSLADMVFHEIREYQRELQRQLKKRRNDFWDLVRHSENEQKGKDQVPLQLMRHDEDGPQLSQVAMGHVDVVDGHLLGALYAHNNHRYEEALERYTTILKLNPRPAVKTIVLVHRGMVAFALGDYVDAIQDFGRSLDGEGDHRKAYYYRAVAHRQMGAFTEALDDLNQCLAIDPYQAEALLSRGQTLVKLGDYSAALQDVDAAIALRPSDEEAHRFRDLITNKLGV